jgi:hypothetical protein
MRRWTGLAAMTLAVACALPALTPAATLNGRSVDDRWYEGRAVSNTWGGYKCQMKFHGDRVFIRLEGAGVEVVGVLDDEELTDPHEIVVHDPKRGGDWTLDCINMGH